MDKRYTKIVLSAFLFILTGAGMVYGLSDKCKVMSQNNCWAVWGLAASAIIGGVILTESFVIYRIKYYEEHIKTSSETKIETDVKQQLSGRYVWLRSVARLLLATLLLGLPVIAQGTFVAAVGGLIVGFSLVFFVRSIVGRLPPTY